MTRSWAENWKTVQPPVREQNKNAFWAEFEDPGGNSARVRITEQALALFGEVPRDLEANRHRTEMVLRAVLETYVNKHGLPSRELEPADLGSDLEALRREFREQAKS